MNNYQSALPLCGDIVYWEDTVAGHGTFNGTVEQCDSSGVLVSVSFGNGVRFVRIRYEAIVRVIRAPKP